MEAAGPATEAIAVIGGAATPSSPKARHHMFKLLVQAQTSLFAAADALRRREDGQTMAEYGVVLAVIVLAVITAITLLSTRVQGAINAVAGVLPG
jgi:Flp pilus assembly pilin Flp